MRAVALAGVLALGAVAHADTAAEKKKQANERYQRAMTHYNLGEFDEAIAEFKAAYEISQAPELLFNIGQAFRLKEDYKQALFFYDTYLRLRPDAKNRADVEKWIAEMKRLIDEKRGGETSPPASAPASVERPPTPPKEEVELQDPGSETEAQPPPEATPVETPVPERPVSAPDEQLGRGLRIVGLVAGGLGVAMAGTGVYFAFRAQSDWQMISDLADRRGNWNNSYDEVEADGERSEAVATILIPVGAAALVAGGVIYYLGWRDSSAPRAAAAPGGRGMVLEWSF
jgi:tetratricopeptide (TPR) repeat protein